MLNSSPAARKRVLYLPLAASIACSTPAGAGDMRGNLSAQADYFFSEAAQPDADWQASGSVSADVEFYQQIADNVSLIMRPFVRVDTQNDDRTHADMREFILTTNGQTERGAAWEFSGGLGQVFWGVTESRNPVDVINQIDTLEGADGADKLGQLMLTFKWFNDYGDFEIYALPHFRERSFISAEGRPFAGFTVNRAATSFESSEGTRHVDAAVRWSRSFDSWDIGLHYFTGTSRDPAFVPSGPAELAPRYQQMQQTGIDALGIYGDLNVKAEIIYRRGDEFENHAQAVFGSEYTLVGALAPLQDKELLPTDWCAEATQIPLVALLCNDRLDVGLVIEYLWDERDELSSQPFQNDLLAGLRFAFNDERSSEALIGIVRDLDNSSTTFSLEASTRLFESFRLSAELRSFSNTSEDPFLQTLADEDFLSIELSYFF